MNRLAVLQELDEAKIAIDQLMNDIRSGTCDAVEDLSPLAVDIEHILCHISRAWHFRALSDSTIDHLSQEEFNRMSYSVPNLFFNFTVVDAGASLLDQTH
jgi:hypothetical protein